MRTAIVHDWLLGMRGGERCLSVIAGMFPDADIYTLFYAPEEISSEIRAHKILVSCLQSVPAAKSIYRYLLPFYAFGVRDLERKISRGQYDLLISISHCVAKNVNVQPPTFHLCYCLTPARYLWDQYQVYFGRRKLEPLIRMIALPLRRADLRGVAGVGHFVAISDFVKHRIHSVYGRAADVVYPPVRTDWIKPRNKLDAGTGFLAVNALVPYKNTQIIVEAFNLLKLPLTVVGRGPEEKALKSIARGNIRFVGAVTDQELARLYSSAKALIFAAEEDFGMVPVEVQAAGRPVICYGRGGVLETVSAERTDPTGMLFSELSVAGLVEAVQNFMVRQADFTVDNCIKQAGKFSVQCFRDGLDAVLRSQGVIKDDPSVHGIQRHG